MLARVDYSHAAFCTLRSFFPRCQHSIPLRKKRISHIELVRRRHAVERTGQLPTVVAAGNIHVFKGASFEVPALLSRLKRGFDEREDIHRLREPFSDLDPRVAEGAGVRRNVAERPRSGIRSENAPRLVPVIVQRKPFPSTVRLCGTSYATPIAQPTFSSTATRHAKSLPFGG